jgi:hypothetical protein
MRDPGSGIRDKHPSFATLLMLIKKLTESAGRLLKYLIVERLLLPGRSELLLQREGILSCTEKKGLQRSISKNRGFGVDEMNKRKMFITKENVAS